MRNKVVVTGDHLHEAILRIMDAEGCNVTEFAARYGLTRVTMSNIVNGKRKPSAELLAELGIERVYLVPAKYAPKRESKQDGK